MKAQKFIPLLIIAAGLLAYHNSFTGPFIFDDVIPIQEDLSIRHLWPLWNIIGHSSRPVVKFSLAVNYALGGLNPWGYHLFNIIIHIVAALTLYGVVRRTFLSPTLPTKWREAVPWLAAAVAVIWVVHPLQTESVTYTIQRCESLMGLFILLMLYCVIRGSASPRSVWWNTGAVVGCALAMGCKPVAVTAPVLAALYDRVFLAGSWREIFQRRGRLYMGFAVAWLLLSLLLAYGPSEWKGTAGFDYRKITPLQYALTQSGVIAHYLRLVFWPYPLCFDYSGWPVAHTAADVWPGLIVVCALLAATIWAWRRKPALGFLGAWFFIILAPTSSFIPIADLAFEHRMYLPLAAVIVPGVMGIYTLAGRRTAAVVAVLAIALGTLTWRRNQDYRGNITIWEDTVGKWPQNPRAHYNLGLALGLTGRKQEEIEQYERALRLNPDYTDVHVNLGHALLTSGRTPEAIGHFEQALRIEPGYAEAHNDLGVALMQVGRIQDAIGHYVQALQDKPDYAAAHYNLGIALRLAGKMEEAIEHLEQALRINPNDTTARHDLSMAVNNLAWQLATHAPSEGGDPARSVALAQRACTLTGNSDFECLDTLAAAYAAAGRFNDAVTTAQKSIELARAANQMQAVSGIAGRLEFTGAIGFIGNPSNPHRTRRVCADLHKLRPRDPPWGCPVPKNVHPACYQQAGCSQRL